MKAVKGFLISLTKNVEATLENYIENSKLNCILPKCNLIPIKKHLFPTDRQTITCEIIVTYLYFYKAQLH